MVRIIKKFSRLLDKRQKNKVIIILIMMIIGACWEVLSVGLLIPLISVIMDSDIIENNFFIGRFCNFFGIQDSRQLLIVFLGMLIMVFIAKNIYLIAEYYVQYRFVYNNRFSTQKKVLYTYMHRSYEFFLNADSGEIVRTVNSDVAGCYSLLLSLLSIATETIVALTLVITILIINPFITIVTGVVLAISMAVIAFCIKPRLKKAGQARQNALADTYKWILQSIDGIKEIKISQTEGYFQRQYNKNGELLIRMDQRNSVYMAVPRMLIEMTTTSTALLVVSGLALMGVQVTDLIPALSAFVMAAAKLLPSANRIVNGINMIAFQEPALDQLLEKLEVLDNKEKQGINHNENMAIKVNDSSVENIYNNDEGIRLSNIVYKYPNSEKYIINHAEMYIPLGHSVGIVGSSGAGKTTIVDILLGLLEIQSGNVTYKGREIKKNDRAWLCNIGYIPQMIFMLDDTIRANVVFGREGRLSEEDWENVEEKMVWEALERAQLADFVRSIPDGINTTIGEKGIRLSGGQRQRIGIARALYMNPEILVFDEATSALDNETEATLMESINALHGEKTMIIIAHRLTTIEECDIVYRVEDGKIIRER